jgi:hypothetical protein
MISHGHHTASAHLAQEAFRAASDRSFRTAEICAAVAADAASRNTSQFFRAAIFF